MAPEENALLAAVLAAPHDDAVRLVLADWYDDHDQPQRAEFVRLQVRLSRLPMAALAAAGAERAREQELLAGYAEEWTPPRLAELFGPRVGFRRGLPAALAAQAESFLSRAAEAFALTPLEELNLDHSHGRLDRLAELPQCAQLTLLRLAGHFDLFTGGEYRFFRYLVTDTDIDDLAAADLGRLRSLELPQCEVSAGGAATLCRAGLRELETLDLSGAWAFDDYAAGVLADSGGLPRLARLTLDQTSVADAGLVALVASRGLPELSRLSLEGCRRLSGLGVRDAARQPGLRRLRVLVLPLNDEPLLAARALAESPHLNDLRYLSVIVSDRSAGEIDAVRAALGRRFGGRYSVRSS